MREDAFIASLERAKRFCRGTVTRCCRRGKPAFCGFLVGRGSDAKLIHMTQIPLCVNAAELSGAFQPFAFVAWDLTASVAIAADLLLSGPFEAP